MGNSTHVSREKINSSLENCGTDEKQISFKWAIGTIEKVHSVDTTIEEDN